MGKEVRILIIEDSEDDSLVVVCRLKQGNHDRGDVEVCLRLFEEGRYAVVADDGPEGAC